MEGLAYKRLEFKHSYTLVLVIAEVGRNNDLPDENLHLILDFCELLPLVTRYCSTC